MSDNLDKLFQAARTANPDTSRAEYGFETRLLARVRSERAASQPWFALAWRLMPVFAAIVVILGVWSWNTFTPVSLETAFGANSSTTFLGE